MHNGLKKFLEKWCRMRGVPKPQGWEMGLGSSWVIACEKWNASSCLGNFAQTEPQDLELFQVRIQSLATSLFISHRVPWLRLIPCRFSINTYQQLCWSSAGALGGFSFIFFRHSFCFEHLVYTDSTKQGFIHLSNFLINYVYSDKLEALSSAFLFIFFHFPNYHGITLRDRVKPLAHHTLKSTGAIWKLKLKIVKETLKFLSYWTCHHVGAHVQSIKYKSQNFSPCLGTDHVWCWVIPLCLSYKTSCILMLWNILKNRVKIKIKLLLSLNLLPLLRAYKRHRNERNILFPSWKLKDKLWDWKVNSIFWSLE